MKKTTLTAGLCLLLSSHLAIAASTLVVSSPIVDGSRIRSSIESFDSSTLRIHVGTAPDYLLVLAGKLYSVNGKSVRDITDVRAQIRMPSIGEENIRLLTNLEDTGRVETIAGLVGKVFTLRYQNKDTQSLTEEIVLTDDSRVREITQAWRTYFNDPEHSALRGREVLHDYLDAHQLGILRLGDQYRVESFGVVPAADRFALPVSPTP